MKIKNIGGWIFLLIVLIQITAFAQINIDLRLFNQNTQVLYVGDLDFLKQGGGPNLFSLTLQNESDSPQQIELHFRILYNNATIGEVYSRPFTMPANTTVMFHHHQLVLDLAVIPGTNETVELKDYTVNLDVVPNLLDQTNATGRLPSGLYKFHVEALLPDNNIIADQLTNDNILTITNPTTLELIAPGQSASGDHLTELPSLNPYFFWQSNAAEFNIFVYQQNSADQSIQDVLSHDPVLQVEGYPNRIFQYPTDPGEINFIQSGGEISADPFDPLNDGPGRSIGPIRPLENGKVYYWFVQAKIITGNEITTIDSDVFKFQIIATSGGTPTENLILVYLRQILGDQYYPVMQQLQDADPTGKILLNRAAVEPDFLLDLINKLNSSKAELQQIFIE